MSATNFSTKPIVRPVTGARVEVTYGGSEWSDPEVVTGVVVAQYDDGFDVLNTATGEDWTLLDNEQADATCVVAIL